MNAHYMFPSAFDVPSPDSVSPPMSASGTTPEFAFTHDVRLPEFTGEMLQHGRIQANPRGLYSSHNYSYPHSPGPDPIPGSLTDFDFAKSLRDVHTSRSTSSHSQGQGKNGSEGSDGPTESEAAVAETIVRARKSWKTVKGRSEPVWPPHLEKALVQALLQYKPHDSRYARALGRFPKRNRFISDFIFEATGVRRSPKQVGSRLQQLKDVTCGKMLLNHVANWSLAPESTPLSESESDANISPSSLGPNLSVIISNADGCGSEGSQSPISPLAGARYREGALAEAALEPHNVHSRFNPSSLAQFHRGLAGSSAPSSPYNSPPLTPFLRTMDVFVSFYPMDLSNSFNGDHKGGSGLGDGSRRHHPFMRFGGCLARPETVFAPTANDIRIAPDCREPRVTFVARDPTAAQSVSRVWINGMPRSSSAPISPSVLGPSPSLMQGQRAKGTKVQVHEQNQPLVCVQTPVARASAAQTSFYSFDKIGLGAGTEGRTRDEDDRNCFVYETRLVDDSLWGEMRREADLSRYTVTQELMYSFDSPTTVRGETFLIITYHFVPVSSYDPSSLSPVSSLDMRGQGYSRGYARGSVSPASSNSPSPISVNSASLMRPSLHSQQQGYGSSSHAHVQSLAHAHERVGPHFYTAPHPPVISSTGGLMNSFGQAGLYDVNGTGNVNMANGSFADYSVNLNELNLQQLHLSAEMGLGSHPGL